MATDGGSGFDSVMSEMLPHANHLRCIWHIWQNVKRNLEGPLSPHYPTFCAKFSKLVHSMRTADEFDVHWGELVKVYPAASDYLNRELYKVRYKWASCWTNRYTTHFFHITFLIHCTYL
jgi:hypothetical protein